MSGGGQTSGSQNSQPIVPANLRYLIQGGTRGWEQALKSLGGAGGALQSLLQASPEQIAPLTAAETGNINQLENIAQYGSPEEAAQESLLSQLTSGAIGSSPATAAAMRAYTQNVQPTIASSLVGSGGGRGGELQAALTQGQTSAYVPLVQQEIQNRMGAVPLYAQLGAEKTGDITTAMGASDLQRQIQQAGLSSVFADQQRRQQLMQELALWPVTGLAPATLGQTTVSTGSTSPGKF